MYWSRYRYAVQEILLPVCREFQPDLVLISAGELYQV